MELFAASFSGSDGMPRFEGGVLFYYSPRPPEGFGGRENGKIIHFGLFGSSGNFYRHEPARKNRIFEPDKVDSLDSCKALRQGRSLATSLGLAKDIGGRAG